ncbi:hypothetical protein M8J76_015957 [Diaphorina citri]|nr:hypothetical protein M8J76_015957 [Diaphorina citri]
MPIVSLESTQLRNSVNISEADKETSSPKSFHEWSEAVNDRDKAPSGLLDYPADKITEIEHFKSMLSTELNISDRMEFYDTNIIPQYPVDLDLGDFDDLSHSVQAIFNDFGTKYKSEILNDQYTYEYYVYKNTLVREMNGLMEFASVPPPGNALPEFNEDEEYGDFGTLFIDEQQIDFEEYYESLLSFDHQYTYTMSDEILDPILIQVREKLNKDSIKLWLSPYLSSDATPDTTALQELSVSIGQTLNLDHTKVLPILLDLQQRALTKLKQKETFLATGIANLKIRISGKTSQVLNEKISLTSPTEELQALVAEKLDVVPSRIKLISKGSVLNKTGLLADQGVKNGSVLMAVILSEDQNEVQNAADRQKDLQTTFSDIDLLTNGDSPVDTSYVQIADQSGKNLTLPKEEEKSLVTAMVLHEKGRAALEKKDYARALVFLLEADNRFNSILDSVDNYAVLNLDIAWSYLCLESVTQLPEGEDRLRKCERSFHKSYGPNLERLMTIKGSTGNEQALFMRLHLLQGIVAYHQSKIPECIALLDRAESYSEKEARFGLRGAYGNVERAVQIINKRREDKAEAKKKNKEDKLHRALG